MSKYQHLKNAPKNLLDIDYCLKVAKGLIPPSEYALNYTWPDKFKPADEIANAEESFAHGYSQGFEAELGGRAFLPTPPVGMQVRLLPHFCEGIMSGSENVRRAREASGHEGGDDSFDPFADLDHHDI